VSLSSKLRRAKELISSLGSAAVALSGGVDSSLLTALAAEALPDVVAFTVNSPLLPPWELDYARAVAEHTGVKHVIVDFNELNIAGFTKNTQERCYLCKKARYSLLTRLASRMGLAALLDGTTASDLTARRPGLKAMRELGVRAPLAEAGLTKQEVREAARSLKLPTAGKPQESCLATRIPAGEEITLERVFKVRAAEQAVRRALGEVLIRVRDHGEIARIEVARSHLLKAAELLPAIAGDLRRLGYKYITLDLEGYREASH